MFSFVLAISTTTPVNNFRPPAVRHCTFAFGPPKSQTQPPKPPRPSLQLLFQGSRLRFRVHNHNKRSHDKWSRQRKVTACFADPLPQNFPRAARLRSDSKNCWKRARVEHAARPSTCNSPATHPPAIALGFWGVAFVFLPHPAPHFRGVR